MLCVAVALSASVRWRKAIWQGGPLVLVQARPHGFHTFCVTPSTTLHTIGASVVLTGLIPLQPTRWFPEDCPHHSWGFLRSLVVKRLLCPVSFLQVLLWVGSLSSE